MARKSLKDEIQVIKYMTDLAGPTFDYLQSMYLTGEKEDKKWAVEQMMKLYAKAIPTELTSDPENPIITVVKYAYPNGDNTTLQVPAETVPDTTTQSV